MINMTSIYSAIESDNPTILNYFLKNPLYNKYIFQEIVHIEEIFSLSTNRKAHFIIDFLFDNDLMNGFSNTHLITLMVLENKNETFKHIYSHPKCSLDLTYDNYKLLKYMCSQDAYDLIDYYLNEKKVKLNDTIINWLKGNNELDTDYYKEIEKIQLYNKLNHTDEHLKNNPLKNKL